MSSTKNAKKINSAVTIVVLTTLIKKVQNHKIKVIFQQS